MSTDSSSSDSPLPGLPKAIFYIQILSALLTEIKSLLDSLHSNQAGSGKEDS